MGQSPLRTHRHCKSVLMEGKHVVHSSISWDRLSPVPPSLCLLAPASLAFSLDMGWGHTWLPAGRRVGWEVKPTRYGSFPVSRVAAVQWRGGSVGGGGAGGETEGSWEGRPAVAPWRHCLEVMGGERDGFRASREMLTGLVAVALQVSVCL